MEKRTLMIINPSAGKTATKDQLMDVIERLTKGGHRVTIYPTSKPSDAKNIVIEESKDYDMIICAGGDGTLDDTVSGYMISGCRLPLGYIPAGSTNDFARSLGIPLETMPAVMNIMTGLPFWVDIGSFNEKDYFVYIAAFGAFTEVSYSTDQRIKNMFGHTAYILKAIRSLNQFSSYKATVTYGDTTFTDTFIYAMITNSLSVGGLRNVVMSENVEFDDGEFECLMIKEPKTAIEFQEIINSLMLSEVNLDYMYNFKASEVIIDSETPIPWTRDGEFGGEHTHVVIKNHQKAVPIML